MKTITRAELLALGGAPDALFAVFYPSGELYFTTTAPEAEVDRVVLLGEYCETKKVVP
jgi:hypothetical protein